MAQELTGVNGQQIVDNVQGVIETWLGGIYAPEISTEYKVLHLMPPTGTKPGVLFLELEPRELLGDQPVQRFMIEISATAIP